MYVLLIIFSRRYCDTGLFARNHIFATPFVMHLDAPPLTKTTRFRRVVFANEKVGIHDGRLAHFDAIINVTDKHTDKQIRHRGINRPYAILAYSYISAADCPIFCEILSDDTKPECNES